MDDDRVFAPRKGKGKYAEGKGKGGEAKGGRGLPDRYTRDAGENSYGKNKGKSKGRRFEREDVDDENEEDNHRRQVVGSRKRHEMFSGYKGRVSDPHPAKD